MARNVLGTVPFPPIQLVDQDEPIRIDKLRRLLGSRSKGISICVRYASGPKKRGGYFFHLCCAKAPDGEWEIRDFTGRLVETVDIEFLCRFINHCTGRQFDQECFEFVTHSVNLRDVD